MLGAVDVRDVGAQHERRLRGPGIRCSSGAWPGESWIASGAASTSVAIARSMSSIPARNEPSPKKPWSTATSKQRPSAANRRFRRGVHASASSIVGSPSAAPTAVVASAPTALAKPAARSSGQPCRRA